ncbi:MAG: thermonuclease family protein [Rickettsiales bacterium]|nr:thermonuclease family protein [Rickettsiales bacterium]
MNFKKIMSISCLTIISLKPVLANENCIHSASHLKCLEFVKIKSADRAVFNIPNLHPLIGKDATISIAGVRSPSPYSKDKCAKEVGKLAKNFSKSLLKKSKVIEVKNIRKEKRFSYEGDLIIDNKDMSKILLKNNFAFKDADFKNVNWCDIKKNINK